MANCAEHVGRVYLLIFVCNFHPLPSFAYFPLNPLVSPFLSLPWITHPPLPSPPTPPLPSHPSLPLPPPYLLSDLQSAIRVQEETVQTTQASLTEAEAGLKKLRKVIHQVKEDRSYYRTQAEQTRYSLPGEWSRPRIPSKGSLEHCHT